MKNPSELQKKREHLKRLSFILDNSIKVPKTNITLGVDSLLGLIPGVGDFAGAGLSLYLIYSAFTLGVSKTKILSMFSNSCFDALLGIVPFFGDAFDVYFKSNSRNVDIIEEAIDNGELSPRSGKFFLIILFLVFAAIFVALFFLISFLTVFLYKLVFA